MHTGRRGLPNILLWLLYIPLSGFCCAVQAACSQLRAAAIPAAPRRCVTAGVEMCVRVCRMGRVHARHVLPARTASCGRCAEQVYVCVQRCAESCVVWDGLGVCGRGAFACALEARPAEGVHACESARRAPHGAGGRTCTAHLLRERASISFRGGEGYVW